MGQASIYFLAALNLISCLGCSILYFIIFSKIAASITKQAFNEVTENSFKKRTLYVLTLGALLIPICLKKKLAEMKFLSVLFFNAIGLSLSFVIQLITLGSILKPDKTDRKFSHV